MFCPKCGKKNSDNASFCSHCGYSANSNPHSRKQQKSNNAKIAVLVILIAIVLSIILGLVSYLAFLPKDKKTPDNTDTTTSDVLEKDSNSETDNKTSDTSENDIKKDSEDESETPTPTLTPEKKTTALLEDMSSDEKKTLNTFLSNFSEAFYKISSSGNEVLEKIQFAFHHNLINNPEKIIYTDEDMGISASDVDATLKKYFGSSVPHKSPQSDDPHAFRYENGNFLMPGADGESYAYFSIATDMSKNSNGTYTVTFNTYFDEENMHEGVVSDWYSYTPDEALEKCEFVYSGTAIVKEKNYNGKDTYELVSYAVEQY